MLLVTVGTTSFDELVQAVDEQAQSLSEKIEFQIGSGTYIPKSGTHFRFDPNMAARYARAELVICHGGAATVFEALRAGLPVVAVENPRMQGRHQRELLGALEAEGAIAWCRDMANLEMYAQKAVRLERYRPPKSVLAVEVRKALGLEAGRP